MAGASRRATRHCAAAQSPDVLAKSSQAAFGGCIARVASYWLCSASAPRPMLKPPGRGDHLFFLRLDPHRSARRRHLSA
eukprot:scaffold268_cov134-Isochrysis_galbana.AAC.9